MLKIIFIGQGQVNLWSLCNFHRCECLIRNIYFTKHETSL